MGNTKSIKPPSTGSSDAHLEELARKAKEARESGAPRGDSSRRLEVGTVVRVPIGELADNPEQPRKTFDRQKLEELKASILEQGLLQPVVVCRPMQGELTLVNGHTRRKAFQELHESGPEDRRAEFATIPAYVRTGMEAPELALAAYTENSARAALNVVEEAAALARLRKLYELEDAGQVAEKVGQPDAMRRVRRLLHLHDNAPDFLKAAVRGQDISGLLKLADADATAHVFEAPEYAEGGEGEGARAKSGEKPSEAELSHRRLDLLAAIEFIRLYEHHRGADEKTATKKTARAVVLAMAEGWSLRRVTEYVAGEMKRKKKAVAKKADTVFEVDTNRLVVNLKKLSAATAEQLDELQAVLESHLAAARKRLAEGDEKTAA